MAPEKQTDEFANLTTSQSEKQIEECGNLARRGSEGDPPERRSTKRRTLVKLLLGNTRQYKARQGRNKEEARRVQSHTKTILKHLEATRIHPQKFPKASPRFYLLWRTSWCLQLFRRAEANRLKFQLWYNPVILPSINGERDTPCLPSPLCFG